MKEDGSETPKEPTHKMSEMVDVKPENVEAVIEAAEEYPGECIFLEMS